MPAPDHTPLVQVAQLCLTYRTGEVEVRAVRDVTLTVERGDFVAIMGPSGSGKSSLMNLIGCLDTPTSGQYLLDGIDVASLSRAERATLRNRKLGFVFQSFHLLGRTSATENAELPLLYGVPLLPARERRRRAIAALERVGLGARLDHHPAQLSGGQQQRIAIARALVAQPELLLADEPTGNLDSRTTIEIMGLFQELNDAGLTIVMVTHELDVAAYCRRVIVMRDGRVVSDVRNAERPVATDALRALDDAQREALIA
ncbi:MAG: ABC transporter ATP-binding protein [Gemmatimonadaceae bacterium]|nr:ABC transporter ATP-binding protein [Gemmatimonadaceae bacterium]